VKVRLVVVTVAATTAALTGAWPASGASESAKNLVVTPAVRRSLLVAGARYHRLPAKDYVGLTKGMTYYAFDATSATYYASAGLDPSPNSLAAQVGAQDDGGYNLFVRREGATTWTVYNDGLGASPQARCPLSIPRAVLTVWGWTLRCFPPPS
jgi:hypothetical protein